MRKIVFINQDSGYLMIDIVNAHAEKGYECVLMTGRLIERNTSLSKSVKVEKIIHYNRSSTFRRLFSWIYGFIQIFIHVLFKYRKHELFIVSNPPIAPLLPMLIKKKFRLLIFDIYPEAFVELGFMKENSLILKLWEKSNLHTYKKASKVYCLSNGMMRVLSKYCPESKIKVVPLWSNTEFLKPIEKKDNSFIKLNNLQDKFIVLYSGNIGLSSGVEFIIEIAKEFSKNKNIVFLLIGEGAKKKLLEKNVWEMNLDNVQFLPWQESAQLPFSLSSGDLSIVSLSDKVSKLAIPSKLFSYISVGSPILCFADRDSDLASLVLKYEFGEVFSFAEKGKIVNYIQKLLFDKVYHNKISTNALMASKCFTSSNAKQFVN